MQNGTYGLCYRLCKRKVEQGVLGRDSEKRSDRLGDRQVRESHQIGDSISPRCLCEMAWSRLLVPSPHHLAMNDSGPPVTPSRRGQEMSIHRDVRNGPGRINPAKPGPNNRETTGAVTYRQRGRPRYNC